MRRYLALLRVRPFAMLWAGSTASAIGDALTWVALVWLVIETEGSPAAVGGLVVAATAPVLVGGFAVGSLLDRFERRRVLVGVNVVLGCAVASVPLLANAGLLRTWHLHVVAGLYGLLKMANWAGVPALIPSLVAEPDLNTANAMESVSFNVADVAGPALAGVLIGVFGAENVLVVDAASYLLFVGVLVGLRVPAQTDRGQRSGSGSALRPAFAFLRRQPAVLAIQLMFMAFNVGEGMLLVLLPVYARRELGGDASTFGLLLSSFALAATAGSMLVGGMPWRWPLGRSVAACQAAAGAAFLGLLLVPGVAGAATVLALAGFLASPCTIWAQTIRMRVIPAELRGRTFAVLRTLMQSTPPIGGALAGLLLTRAGVTATVVLMSTVMAVPGAIGLLSPALLEEHTRAIAEPVG